MNQDGILHEYNLYYLGGKKDIGVPLGKGEKVADPMFESIKNRNFHLQPQSAAIDAGTRLQHTKDFDGNQVPNGSATDMGAYEYLRDVRR